jgi:hypothetical protein
LYSESIVRRDHRVAVYLLAALQRHTHDTIVLHDRPGHLGRLPDLGTCRLGVLEQQRVQLGAAHGVSVVGHAGALRERQLPLARAEYRDPVDAVKLGDLVG